MGPMAVNAAKNCQGEKAGRLHSDVPLKYVWHDAGDIHGVAVEGVALVELVGQEPIWTIHATKILSVGAWIVGAAVLSKCSPGLNLSPLATVRTFHDCGGKAPRAIGCCSRYLILNRCSAGGGALPGGRVLVMFVNIPGHEAF